MILYKQIADFLSRQILSGELKKGDMIPSETRLMKEFCVSRSTVRTGLQELEKAGCIYAGRGKGRFVKDDTLSRRALSGENSSMPFTIKVIGAPPPAHVDTLREAFSYNIELVNGLLEAFYLYGVKARYSDVYAEEQFFHEDGVIMYSSRDEHYKKIKRLHSAGRPLVVINPIEEIPGAGKVAVENFKSSRKLVSYLTDLGHKKIGCLTVPVSSCGYAGERVDGYREALSAAGIEFDEGMVLEVSSSQGDILSRIGQWWKKHKDLTAVFIAGSSLQRRVLYFFKKEGIQVPADISVAAFDKVVLEDSGVEITCVEQPLELMAKKSVELIISMIKDGRNKPLTIELEPDFKIGNSCLPVFSGRIAAGV